MAGELREAGRNERVEIVSRETFANLRVEFNRWYKGIKNLANKGQATQCPAEGN